MDVFVAGGCSYNSMVYLDEFPSEAGTHSVRQFQETVGSTGSGKTMNLGRLGLDVTFHATIGRDRYGEIIEETFAAEPATFLHDVDPNGTERHVNLMNADGERISLFVVESTPDPDLDYGRLDDLVATSDAFVVNPVDYTRPLLATAERHDTPVWCDVHDYDGEDPHFEAFVEAADYLFLSQEGIDDAREFMREQIDAGTELVVCTRGADGSTALTSDGTWLEQPAEPFEMIDTNGAGDAYVSGFLYGHAHGEDVETCMRLGTLAGGLAVESWDLAHPDLSADRLAAEYERRYGDEQ
jgi:sugar/nucleoside kinase (ribokinase family)